MARLDARMSIGLRAAGALRHRPRVRLLLSGHGAGRGTASSGRSSPDSPFRSSIRRSAIASWTSGRLRREMAMVLAFVLFGVTLSPLLDDVDLLPTLVLAILLVLLLRPAVLNLVLVRAHISWEARALVAWFGPRGLNSLLLALLALQAGLPEAERLLVVVGFVVLVSVVLHGASAGPLVGWYDQRARRDTLEEERESTAAGLLHDHPDGSRLIRARRVGAGPGVGGDRGWRTAADSRRALTLHVRARRVEYPGLRASAAGPGARVGARRRSRDSATDSLSPTAPDRTKRPAPGRRDNWRRRGFEAAALRGGFRRLAGRLSRRVSLGIGTRATGLSSGAGSRSRASLKLAAGRAPIILRLLDSTRPVPGPPAVLG